MYLMCDIWSGICYIPSRLGQDPLMIIAIEQGVFGLFAIHVPPRRSRRDLVSFQTGLQYIFSVIVGPFEESMLTWERTTISRLVFSFSSGDFGAFAG